jgi:hypothetical protein
MLQGIDAHPCLRSWPVSLLPSPPPPLLLLLLLLLLRPLQFLEVTEPTGPHLAEFDEHTPNLRVFRNYAGAMRG